MTVYEDDDEAEKIWFEEIGIDRSRFSRCGAKDNFWSMGDTGPCGPCSEIFYDHGEDVPGGPPGSPDEDGDRYIEIWNLVFMQFDRAADGTMTPLPRPSVDTGMGLERIAAVLQHVHSNYEIDLFRNLIEAVMRETGNSDADNKSLRVVADHIRACSFMICDGVVPSNEGRGYVLRRIARRAIRHGHHLGQKEVFFHRLVAPLVAEMGDAFPELAERQSVVERVLRQEEERFAETLDQGMRLLEQAIAGLDGDTIPGDTVFKLYDTYGFPVDLTADVARERGLKVDEAGFESAMASQRERARSAGKWEYAGAQAVQVEGETEFTGYTESEGASKVVALLREGAPVEALGAGEQGAVVLESTPFYAESGGQVGDTGLLLADGVRFEVADTQRQGEAVLHLGTLAEGKVDTGAALTACIDAARRLDAARNHSATHLLHAALRKILGTHVLQKGSLVAPDRLRFDFSHFEALSPEQVEAIERQVNEWALANDETRTELMALDDARNSGAMALFGEKYADPVRVLSFGDYSVELCGGTHVSRAGDIGLFKILSESGIAAGVRRIEAISGDGALAWLRDTQAQVERVAALLKTEAGGMADKVESLLAARREQDREIARLKQKLASGEGTDLASRAVDVGGLKILAARLDEADPKTLRDTVDQLKNKLKTAVIVLATVRGDKVSLVAGVTSDRTDSLSAGALVNHVAGQVGGKGGGRADMAQAGGTDASALDSAIASVEPWVRERLSA